MHQSATLEELHTLLFSFTDNIRVSQAKLEDLLFRAQRISHALRHNSAQRDNAFGYDLQSFRGETRAFAAKVDDFLEQFRLFLREAHYDSCSAVQAQAFSTLAQEFGKGLASVCDQAHLAHTHIGQTEHRMEVWYLIQEVETLIERSKELPSGANQLLVKTRSSPSGPTPPSTPA